VGTGIKRKKGRYKMSKTKHSNKRRRLEETRIGITRKASVANLEYYITVNFFGDTVEPGEVFIKIAKEGSTLSGLIDALCVTISVALQYGVQWEILGEKYLQTIFEPRDDESSSLVDGISKTISEIIKTRKGMYK